MHWSRILILWQIGLFDCCISFKHQLVRTGIIGFVTIWFCDILDSVTAFPIHNIIFQKCRRIWLYDILNLWLFVVCPGVVTKSNNACIQVAWKKPLDADIWVNAPCKEGIKRIQWQEGYQPSHGLLKNMLLWCHMQPGRNHLTLHGFVALRTKGITIFQSDSVFPWVAFRPHESALDLCWST